MAGNEGEVDRRGFTTRAIHDGSVPQGIAEEPVGQPIWLTADYLYESLEHYADVINERRAGYVYGRTGNPTHVALHRVLASLEGAEAALSFASGMGALHSTLTALAAAGAHVVAQRTVYGGTFHLLTGILPGYGVGATVVDPGADARPAAPRAGTPAGLRGTDAEPPLSPSALPGVAGPRGVQTLALRLERQCATAVRIASFLAEHPKVAHVGYAGLPSHPDHARAEGLFGERGFGAMLSFSLADGYEAASRASEALRVARVGSSFGGLHTEVCHPGTTSHRQMSAEALAGAGIDAGLIRCSVGGED